MNDQIKWTINSIAKKETKWIDLLNADEIEKAKTFHQSFLEYKETPLVKLAALAKKIDVAQIYVKDESWRFGLNAFKVLGGSFAMGKYLAQRLNLDISELPYDKLCSDEIRRQLGEITFYTATDGNHGRGVAWTANKLKQKAVVYMPSGSSQARLNNILKEGAQASITDMNYDDAVRLAAKNANENNGVVIQDTAWDGYEEIPAWIMQGYGTMALEAITQMKKEGCACPTHVFVQAGVGSLAAGVQGVLTTLFDSLPDAQKPITTIVESNLADCLYQSALAGDGEPRLVGGEMHTIMAGLACGEPNTIGWEILRRYSHAFVSCPDWVAAEGMRLLANPNSGDKSIISGESGAVTIGLLVEIMTNEDYADLKHALKLDDHSSVLVFSTEGDTDPDMYQKIIHQNSYPKP